MQFHFMDRDFHRTGNSIVVISPGCGVFEVDKGLAGITYQRMMDNGIGSDMLSLGLPPLHIVPFFLYNVSIIMLFVVAIVVVVFIESLSIHYRPFFMAKIQPYLTFCSRFEIFLYLLVRIE